MDQIQKNISFSRNFLVLIKNVCCLERLLSCVSLKIGENECVGGTPCPDIKINVKTLEIRRKTTCFEWFTGKRRLKVFLEYVFSQEPVSRYLLMSLQIIHSFSNKKVFQMYISDCRKLENIFKVTFLCVLRCPREKKLENGTKKLF